MTIVSSLTLSLKRNLCERCIVESMEMMSDWRWRKENEKESERERRGREREKEKNESIHIVIGWERQTSICFLANINGVSLRLIDKCLKKRRKIARKFFFLKMIDCFDLSMEFDRQSFRSNRTRNVRRLTFFRPVVIEVWSIESMWAGSSVFAEHIIISFSHLFDLFWLSQSIDETKYHKSRLKCLSLSDIDHLMAREISFSLSRTCSDIIQNIADRMSSLLSIRNERSKEICFRRARKKHDFSNIDQTISTSSCPRLMIHIQRKRISICVNWHQYTHVGSPSMLSEWIYAHQDNRHWMTATSISRNFF